METMFHSCPIDSLENILSEGIMCEDVNGKSGLYVSKSIDGCRIWGEQLSMERGIGHCIIEIEIRDGDMYETDPNSERLSSGFSDGWILRPKDCPILPKYILAVYPLDPTISDRNYYNKIKQICDKHEGVEDKSSYKGDR